MDAGRRAEFRVLGPLEVDAGGQALEIGGPRLRVLLALLLARAGRVLSVPALVDGLWGRHAPPEDWPWPTPGCRPSCGLG